MATALVRHIDDRQIVGMFVYKEPEDLFWLVDQATNPYLCEFINLKYGGIIWENETGPVISNEMQKAWDADDDGESIGNVEDEIFDGARLDSYAFEQAIDSNWTKITKKFTEI